MALKDKWKNTGKSIGGAFKSFGKAVATTAKVAVGDEENEVNEETGKTTLRSAWTDVGHGFGDAGKSIGTSAKGTVDKVAGEEEEEKPVEKPSEEEVIDVEAKDKESK